MHLRRTDNCMPPLTATPPTEAPSATGEKSVLFCPECWYESPVDGNWRVQEGAECDEIGCPVCGATVTTRPTHETEPTDSSPRSPHGGSSLSTSLGLPLSWKVWPCTFSEALPLPLHRAVRDSIGFLGAVTGR